jgi:hypothetical protein
VNPEVIPWDMPATLVHEDGGPGLPGTLAWCLRRSRTLSAPNVAMITFDGEIGGKRTLHPGDIEALLARPDFPKD